jgi:CheY-like chemotaxis protein
MSNDFTVFAVDDDQMIQEILRSILEPHCRIRVFETAECCLQALSGDEKPDWVLLDIGLPGMDGYGFCRLLKDDAKTSQIPVTFISSHDNIDARLQAYDAGGEDFIVKPFEPAELLRKLKVAEHFVQTRRNLEQQVQASDELSNIALASMNDSGILLQYMSQLIGWTNEQEVASGTIDLLRKFSLEGVVQTRIGKRTHTVSPAGENVPLEVAVVNHVSSMGRIFEFHTRAVYNHDAITIMVNNMPLEDSMLCGRIRDSLATAGQGASARLEALAHEESSQRNQSALIEAFGSVQATLDALNQAALQNRYEISQMIFEFEQHIARTVVGLGLSDAQEREMEGAVGQFTRQLVERMDQTGQLQESLQAVSGRLHGLLQA